MISYKINTFVNKELKTVATSGLKEFRCKADASDHAHSFIDNILCDIYDNAPGDYEIVFVGEEEIGVPYTLQDIEKKLERLINALYDNGAINDFDIKYIQGEYNDKR